MLNGIDISNLQGGVQDQTFQSNDFIIAKVTQDVSFVDKFFSVYREQARRAECAFGGYHFADIDLAPLPEASADFFISHLGTQDEGEFGALDLEETEVDGVMHNAQPDQLDWVLRWGKQFSKIANYRPKLYLSQWHIGAHNLNHPEVADTFELWYAYWTNTGSAEVMPAAPSPWRMYRLWQYNTSGLYDKDVWLGTMAELKATGMPKASEQHPYENAYWTPIQDLLNQLVVSHTHADAAFHATVSNAITMHKIALGVEPKD